MWDCFPVVQVSLKSREPKINNGLISFGASAGWMSHWFRHWSFYLTLESIRKLWDLRKGKDPHLFRWPFCSQLLTILWPIIDHFMVNCWTFCDQLLTILWPIIDHFVARFRWKGEKLFPSESIPWQPLKKRTWSDIKSILNVSHIVIEVNMMLTNWFHLHLHNDTYTLVSTERWAPLLSTPSSPPTETQSWWPTSCCRPGRARSGSAQGQYPDSASKLDKIQTLFQTQPEGANSIYGGRLEGWRSGHSSRRCTAMGETRSVFVVSVWKGASMRGSLYFIRGGGL